MKQPWKYARNSTMEMDQEHKMAKMMWESYHITSKVSSFHVGLPCKLWLRSFQLKWDFCSQVSCPVPPPPPTPHLHPFIGCDSSQKHSAACCRQANWPWKAELTGPDAVPQRHNYAASSKVIQPLVATHPMHFQCLLHPWEGSYCTILYYFDLQRSDLPTVLKLKTVTIKIHNKELFGFSVDGKQC